MTSPPRGHWQRLVTSLAITIQRGWYWHLAGRDPGVLLHILQCAGQQLSNKGLFGLNVTNAAAENADSPGCMLVAQLCLILCDLLDCSPPGSSVHGFSRQEYWSGLPFPSPGDLPDPGLLYCRQLLYHLSHQGSLIHLGGSR